MDSLNVEQLINSVLQGALGGKRKKSRGVTRFLTGGKSSFLNASTLLALGGLAWGVYETMTQQGQSGATGTGQAPSPPRPVAQTPVVPPPLPPPLPPLPPQAAPPPVPSQAATPSVSPEILRVLRLTLSAAAADGVLTSTEREAILAQARTVGADAIVGPELDAPRPLAEIAGGIADPRVRQDLYTLAFSMVRADEQVNDGERRYLTELAGHLGLDATTVARLEQDAASRINAASSE